MTGRESIREHKFDQILALLNKADHENTPPDEAATARTLAEKLMRRHAFDEEEIRQAAIRSGGTVETPEIRRINVAQIGNAFMWVVVSVFKELARHCRCRVATGGWDGPDRYFYVVGFSTDIDFLELLLTTTRLAFSSNIEPPFDPNDFDGSVAKMHLAGIEWKTIAKRVGIEFPSEAMRLRRAFYRWCERTGTPREDGHRFSPKVYRESFASGFYSAMYHRLEAVRSQAERDARDEHGDDRMAIALRDRESVVEEFLYERFPNLRPKPVDNTPVPAEPKKRGRYKEPKMDWRAFDAGSSTANSVNLGGAGVSGSGPKGELR
jgi:hypothetical protein